MDHVFLVEDCENSPGRIVAIFSDYRTAVTWAVDVYRDAASVERRTVYSDFPPDARYNE